jgi:hypothetical protein
MLWILKAIYHPVNPMATLHIHPTEQLWGGRVAHRLAYSKVVSSGLTASSPL